MVKPLIAFIGRRVFLREPFVSLGYLRRGQIMAASSTSSTSYSIPSETCSAFGTYPNPLEITEEDRKQFSPVVRFPVAPTVMDLTKRRPEVVQLATEEQRQASAAAPLGSYDYLPADVRARLTMNVENNQYFLGRYDEDRIGVYESEMFDDTTNSIEDFAGRRTLHMGIDLDAPIGTPVHAFYHGKVHCVGKNPALGDYGNVIIIEHELPLTTNDTLSSSTTTKPRLIYALYGHLDDTVPQLFKKGDPIKAGQEIGKMGAIHENGGWFMPHVHFQLSVKAPVTHDLPGAVAMQDRARALVEYPDPRYVLGAIY